MDMKQLTLFDTNEIRCTPKTGSSKFSKWSYSHRNVLEQCARRYYYQYYGSLLMTSNNDPQKEKLNFLKKLENRHLRIGDILHSVIRTYLYRLQNGEQWSLDRILGWSRKMYSKDLAFSRQYEHGTPLPKGDYPPVLLLEFYYGWSNAESLCSDAGERLVAALTNFMTSQNFVQFKEEASDPSTLIEAPTNMKNTYFSLSGKIDLAYRKNGKVIIVDWKTGGSSSGDDSLQMLAYALWAKQKFECPLDTIILHKVYLEDKTFSTFHVGEKDIARVEARILQDLERMQEADNHGRRGLVNAFTPCAQPKVCKLCEFQEICPKE